MSRSSAPRLPSSRWPRRTSPRAGVSAEQTTMSFDAIAGLVISGCLFVYLVYAMLRPEKF
jgi:K+-transporting ATPase KdpF subunit